MIKKMFSSCRLILSLMLIFISFCVRSQEYVSIITEVYRPDDIIKGWVFDHKMEKENISVLVKKDSLFIDDKRFILSEKYDTKESEYTRLERFYAYQDSLIYHFDIFSSKKKGEENIRMFYLTIQDTNYRYFCLRLL